MTQQITILLIGVALLILSCTSSNTTTNYLVDYVDPLIGTAPSTTISALKHGHGSENNSQVVPFVTQPFGMTNWTPQTKNTEQKCVAPYYYKDSIIYGFRGSHWLSGSCVQDYGSVTISPISGKLDLLNIKKGSKYTHKNEQSTPYSYEVVLEDYKINAELTATQRCGLLKFNYTSPDDAHIIITPNSDEGEGYIKIIPENNEIVGYNPVHRIYQGWDKSAGFSGYFVARFSTKFSDYGIYQDDKINQHQITIKNTKNSGAYASFNPSNTTPIYVSVGTSFTSIDNARQNLIAETEHLDFEQAKAQLKDHWNSLLSKITVEGKNNDDKVKFYTALYHSFLHPRTFNDHNGSYPSFAGGQNMMTSKDHDYFVDFSMWDTYRASHPLFNLLIPDKSAEMVLSLLEKGEQGGWLPIFPCWNSYTSAMIGDHATATIAEAFIKGNIELTDHHYQLLLQNAFKSPENYDDYKEGKGRRALESYLKYGYVPLEDPVNESFHNGEQVSRTLEYAYDDFALSQIALIKGDTANYRKLSARAKNYKNVFSKDDLCVRGRHANGKFIDSFKKDEKQPFITEGTPYQYTWYVPHDVAGLIAEFNGEDPFNKSLDHFFDIGQYWHGNEPGHQIPFMYNFSGQPWKTQQIVSDIMEKEYGVGPGGLSGNDDAGQMSAWYVFGALGFYPVCPSVPEYVISGPRFDKITIQLKNNKHLTINAPGASEGLTYIQSMQINGTPVTQTVLKHIDITSGGTIDFVMGSQPNKVWGTNRNDRPYSLTTKK